MKLTVKDLLDMAEQNYRAESRNESLFRFWGYAQRLVEHFGNKPIESFTSWDLREYVESHKQGIDSAVWAQSATCWVVHREMSFLEDGFEIAAQRGLVQKRMVVKGVAADHGEYVSQLEYEKQLAALETLGLAEAASITRFAYLSGWSQGEIFKLTWNDNYKGRAMRLNQRILPLDGELLSVIHEQMQKRTEACLLVFPFRGRRMRKQRFNKYWIRASRESGVEKEFRALQRTAARNMRCAGMSPSEVIRRTGYTKAIPVEYTYELMDAAKHTQGRPRRAAMTFASEKKIPPSGECDSFEMLYEEGWTI